MKTLFELPDPPASRLDPLSVERRFWRPWRGTPPAFTWNGKPIVDYRGVPMFAELALMHDRREAGWGAVWAEAFGGLHIWQTMPTHAAMPSDAALPTRVGLLLQRIRKTVHTDACFDVIAWRGDELVFLEAKHRGKDRLTTAQRWFIEGALKCGVAPECLRLVEWEWAR